MVASWSAKGSRVTLKRLRITEQFPRGWKVRIRCKGKRCPFKAKNLRTGKVRRGASNVIGSLRPGQTVEVWVSAPGYNTKVARYRLRRNRNPTAQPSDLGDASPGPRACAKRALTQGKRPG